jgi:hypothetical protein
MNGNIARVCLSRSSAAPSRSLDIRRVNGDAQQQVERIYQDVVLDALALLAGVIADRVDLNPPFSTDLTVLLSMIAVVGCLPCRPVPGRRRIDGDEFSPASLQRPELKITVHPARRKVLRHMPPRAADFQRLHQTVDHLPEVRRALAPATLAKWDQRSIIAHSSS